MAQNDLLLHDADVADVLNGKPINKTLRTVQRSILRATGLTHGTIDQIKRARLATTLLKSGVSILDTVEQAGYSDQPHLTRSLKRFTGFTPAQIMSEERVTALSFLYKEP
jgi:methylphosphotriester-DNA--protein-cysteine methyltransferase